LPANQVGSPCEVLSLASGSARQIARSRATGSAPRVRARLGVRPDPRREAGFATIYRLYDGYREARMIANSLDQNGGARASRLAREVESLSHGETWHGPALDELLDGVTPEAAAARPIPAGWEAAKLALIDANAALAARVERLSDADLAVKVPGRPFDAEFQVRAAIRHTVYHSGQIGLLRKAAQ
jgi:hypothetical protein